MAAPTLKIIIDTTQYQLPTQDDVTVAKQFVLRRNQAAQQLEDKIDDVLSDAAQRIVTICFRYNINPNEFQINSQYNEQMMNEIAAVMDEIEEEILSLINDNVIPADTSEDNKKLILAWIATLGRGNRNLQDTLDGYLYKFMKDMEAAVAALRYANISLADAITKVKTHLHTIYTMPEVQAAFKEASTFNATYIRSKGVQSGAVGLSNNGSTNVTNMARITLQMAWNRLQGMEFEENGAVGYYQLRGSLYPCQVCDNAVGFYRNLSGIYERPLIHPHCCCYRIPIYSKFEAESLEQLT